jgi:hypothetical protein
METDVNYFAYANLMDIDLIHGVAPSARAIGIACLKDYELTFGKTTDGAYEGARLARLEGAETWGVHYELSEADMAAMDKSAGTDKGHWAHKSVVLHTPDGRTMASTTYDIPAPSGPAGAPAHYKVPLLKGARANQLPPAYIEKLERLLGNV